MTQALFHDIASVAQIAPEITEKFPDAQVLFHVPGNFDVGFLLEDYERAVASQGPKTEIGDDLKKIFSDYGHQILSRIAQDAPDLYWNIIIAMTEISKNAGVYGFDAVAHPVQSSFQPISVQPINPKTGEKRKYEDDDFIPKSHVSAAILYSPAAGQICLLAQNFATASAVQKLTAHFERTNAAIIRDGGFTKGECVLIHETHEANIDEQPLLRKGSPVGSLTEPVCYLEKNNGLTSYRNGTKLVRAKTDNIFVLDSKPEIGMDSIADFPKAKEALERAVAVSCIKGSDLHWLTAGATISVPVEIRNSFPQP